MSFESAWMPYKAQSTAVLFTSFVLFCLHSNFLQACEKIHRFTAQNGTLLSEEKLTHFMGPTSCIWEIQAPHGYRIEITVHVFEIKTSCCSCTEDFVEFRDGSNSTAPLIGRYCANNKPIRVYSSKNALRVRYFSAAKDQHKDLTSVNKFRAKYRRICGQFMRATSGEISSPRAPNFTGYCLYTIVVPYGWVKLTFTNFSIPSVRSSKINSDRCGTGFVVIKEMAHVELKHTNQGPEHLCGTLKSRYVFSRGRELSLFYQPSSLFQSSFVARFEATNKSLATCGGLLSQTEGYIYSYGYPKLYPRNTECVWKIEVPYGHVKLKFLMFNFSTDSSSCNNGGVEVVDGWSANSVKIDTICGRLNEPTFKSLSNRLLFKATSTKSSTTGTFVVSFETDRQGLCPKNEFSCTNRECVDERDVCDGMNDCFDGSDELNCPKKKPNKALYILWVFIVFIASVVMVIWLWRTWRRAVHRTLHVNRDQDCIQEDDYNYEIPSQTGAPPTYNEALQHAPTALPTYEEALLNDNNREVTLNQGNNVRFIANPDRSVQTSYAADV